MSSNNSLEQLCEKHSIDKVVLSISNLPDGWTKLVDELIVDLIGMGWNKDLQQVKEKFGGLRFYIGDGTKEIFKRIELAESFSRFTCEECGLYNSEKVKGSTIRGWYRTLCHECKTLDINLRGK